MATASARAPHFLFEGVGSRGDIAPLISIAGELARRGYRCRLLANEHFGAEATSRGITFSATTSWRVNYTGREVYALENYLFPMFDGARAALQRPNAYDSDTVVVNLDRWAASEPFAEANGLRTVRLHLSPFKIRSLAAPAWPLGANTTGLLGETYRKYTLPALHRAFDTDPKVLGRINGVRGQAGLAPVKSAMYTQPHVEAQVGLFPDWFGLPADDWPAMECLGFPLPSSSEPLPGRLLEFLEGVDKPLVFTPGTSVSDTQAFFAAAVDCCLELGMPGVLLSPYAHVAKQKLGRDIEQCEHAELEGLLRHASLLIHHGGIGTGARALQAGIPQIISPSFFDQFDNARRLEGLGAGRVLAREQLTGSTLAACVRSVCGDTATTEQLRRYRQALRFPCAVERCADLLETVARKSAPRALTFAPT